MPSLAAELAIAIPQNDILPDDGPLPPATLRKALKKYPGVNLYSISVRVAREDPARPLSRHRLRNHRDEKILLPWRDQLRVKAAIAAIVRERAAEFRRL
jgi:hypothetical protein